MDKKVLIIEDSPTDLAVLQSLFEEHAMAADIASSGKDGIEKALQLKPDLITLDLMLPDMTGVEVCGQLRKDPALAKTIIIIVSAKDDMDTMTKAFDAGADDYIIKPPLPDFLVKKIKLYLGER